MKLIRCDTCKETVEAPEGHKPEGWWQRTDTYTRREWHACSRACRDKLLGTPAPI